MQVNCTTCGAPVQRTPTELRRSKRPFCSRSCANSYNNRVAPKRALEGTCRTCKTPVRSIHRYCSKGCRDAALLSRRPSAEQLRQKQCDKVVAWRQRAKLKAVAYKGSACSVCGYSKCIAALEFHHPDPAGKDFGISGKTRSWERIKAELDKCELVCANCHREIHDAWRLAT